MGWFSRKPTREKKIEAAIKVASNLYSLTIPGGPEAVAPLQFNLRDSRFRYLIFCLSATAATCTEEMDLETIAETSYSLTVVAARESADEFFGGAISAEDALNISGPLLQGFLISWAKCVELAKTPETENPGSDKEITKVISFMIHSTESKVPGTEADVKRLGKLAKKIVQERIAMRGAYRELAKR